MSREPTYDPGEPTLKAEDLAIMKRLESLNAKQEQSLRRKALLKLREDYEQSEITEALVNETMQELIREDLEAEHEEARMGL